VVGGAGKGKALEEKGKRAPIVAGPGWTSIQKPPGSIIRRWINIW